MKEKLFTQLVLGIMLFNFPLCYSQNVLSDGDFSSTAVITPYTPGVGPSATWCYWQSYEANAYAAIVSGVCNYQVYYGSNNSYEIQLVQGGFQLTQGNAYRLTFDVKADAERSFGVFLGEDGGSWTNMLGYENYNQTATTEWQTISIEFYVSNVFAFHKLSFEIGGSSTGMYFDNVVLADLGPSIPGIGVIGTALNGWDVDVDMSTDDGITYTLSDYPLTLGALKFRQNNSWSVNWGGTDFPVGTGYQNGPDIPIISASSYDITFNRITGEYTFVCSANCHPAIGISGTAIPPMYNWDSDLNMSTSDGVLYSLNGLVTSDGGARFRQDDNWSINWGGSTFPSGTSFADGPEIPVSAGRYNLTFNMATGDYMFSIPSIGILGSALNGWSEDIDLQTSDGITYTLSNQAFTDGEVKFRQDNDWLINWGGYSFPAGYSWGYGPNIPIMAGDYDVTFNAITGEYIFVAVSCPQPSLSCPDYIYTGTSPGVCGAYVYYPDVVKAPNCGGEGVNITQVTGLPSGSLFPPGLTTNTFVLTNSSGQTAVCSFDVNVYDTEAPVIENANTDVSFLWPPNHKMIPVTVNYDLSDNCSGNVTSMLWVYSNEPYNGIGDGNTEQDWEVIDQHNVLLRAERSGNGTGREYYIVVACWDESWNFNMQQLTVSVPLSMKLKSAGMESENETVPFDVRIWPNPASQYFTLEVATLSEEPVEVSVFDISGRLISKQNVFDKETFRFGDDLKQGTYIVTVRQGGKSIISKVIKQ